MGKYSFYFPVTRALEHTVFNLPLQLNAKCSFSSLWLKFLAFFVFSCKIHRNPDDTISCTWAARTECTTWHQGSGSLNNWRKLHLRYFRLWKSPFVCRGLFFLPPEKPSLAVVFPSSHHISTRTTAFVHFADRRVRRSFTFPTRGDCKTHQTFKTSAQKLCCHTLFLHVCCSSHSDQQKDGKPNLWEAAAPSPECVRGWVSAKTGRTAESPYGQLAL